MNFSNHKQEMFLIECKESLKSLVNQTIYIFIGLIVMLLITGGNPSSRVLILSFITGVFFIAWIERSRIIRQRASTPKFQEDLSAFSQLNYEIKSRAMELEDKKSSSFIFHSQLLGIDSPSISIRVIGDRAVGKTTFLACLNYHEIGRSALIKDITPISQDSIDLTNSPILKEGLDLPPTYFPRDPYELPNYSFDVSMEDQIKPRAIYARSQSRKKVTILNCKEYAGEFLSVLLEAHSSIIETYMEDVAETNGVILLLDGIGGYRRENSQAKSISVFLNLLKEKRGLGSTCLRIAVAIAKCDALEPLIDIKRPRYIMLKRFPSIYRSLEHYQDSKVIEVEYFSISSFAVLGKSIGSSPHFANYAKSEAFSNEDLTSTFSPIYWLITGLHGQEV